MAEVTKTIENVDTLFSQIVVNGTVYNSENYVAPETETTTTTEESTEETNTEEQTEDTTEAEENEEVYAVDLNDVVHNLKDNTARNSVEDINKLIPSNASEINKLVTQADTSLISLNIAQLSVDIANEATTRENVDTALQSDIDDEVTARENADSTLQSDIEAEATARENADTAINSSITNINSSISTINAKIPNQASAQNQLADKNFVNSSIATNTANFLGTYTSMADIEAIQNPTNNDYVFLATTDSAGNTKYDRYKYSADQDEWLFEYELNNSSFTAEQWATINSGLTQSSVNSAISTAVGDEATARANADSALQSDIDDINAVIPSTATSSNKLATENSVSNAVNALDVASVGGSGKYISAISETNGRISATETTMDTTPTQGSTKAVTSGGVYDAITSASSGVTGVKGSAETDYRTGNVNITKANIGLGNVDNVSFRDTAFYGLLITDDTSALSVTSYTFTPTAPVGSTALAVGSVVRVQFRNALQSSKAIATVTFNYGGRSGYIKSATAHMTTIDTIGSHKFSGGTYSSAYPYKVWDAYTTLDLMWTGSEWLIMGDPILCRFAYTSALSLIYTIRASGLVEIIGYTKPSSYSHTVTFPIEFSNSPLVTAVVTNPTSGVTTNVTAIVMLWSVTTTGFSAKVRVESGSGTNQDTSGYCWRAIGI